MWTLIKKPVAAGLSIALGVVFLYSGYTKLHPIIETFEFSFAEMGFPWKLTPFLARITVGIEFFMGLLLLACYRLRKFTIPATLIVLAIFTIHLFIQIVTGNGEGNCGCFGEHIKLTPVEGIVKNLLMMAAAMAAYFLWEGWSLRMNKLFLVVLFIISGAFPFIVNPVDLNYTSNNLDEKVNYPLELDLLYHNDDTSKVEVPTIELRKGKHVVAFLSLTCSHCRIAAKKFGIMKRKNPALPVYFVLNGEKKNLDLFHSDTKTSEIPYSFCLGKTFIRLATTQLPRIYYLEDGMVVRKVDYFELRQDDIEYWVK